jgi:L-rhamnose isomerase
MIKALLIALLEPTDLLKDVELRMDFTQRLVLLEELKSLPWASVWDYYCAQKGAPAGVEWLREIQRYEKDVLARRESAAVPA